VNPGKFFGTLALALAVSSPAVAQNKMPTEAQCRDMVNGMLQAMKAATVDKKDKQGADVVIARAEKVVRENRARGASECDSWKAIGNIVTNQ
jgi:hypothetical protein